MAKSTVYMQANDGNVFSTSCPEYHKECVILSKKEGEKIYREQIAASLLESIQPGSKVYTICDSVAKSGMSRKIRCFIVRDGQISDITYSVSVVTGIKIDGGALRVPGCGMDMGFHVVYTLGACLWPNGTDKPHGKRNGEDDSTGGYALKQSWL